MGSDYGCVCTQDTGEVPVPNCEYKIEETQNIQNNSIIENKKMQLSVISDNYKNNPSNLKKIIKIQSVYKSKITRNNYKHILKNIEYHFDNNIISYAEIIESKNNDDNLKKYTLNSIQQIENNLSPFKPTQNELNKYKLTFKRNIYKFKDKSIYNGTWNYNCKKHGFGIYIDNEGNKYIGYWNNDIINGRGRYISKEGNCYEGNWKNGKAEGEGTLSLNNGYYYKGNWKNDKQEGEGIERYQDLSNYTGNFKNGNKNGEGVFNFSDGSYYKGNFVDGVAQGYGIFHWKDGRNYEGNWINNQMEGKGIFTWPGGNKYDGNYKKSRKEGYGIYYWSKDNYYSGYWMNNVQHGKGAYYENKKLINKGIYRYGKLIKTNTNEDFNSSGQNLLNPKDKLKNEFKFNENIFDKK